MDDTDDTPVDLAKIAHLARIHLGRSEGEAAFLEGMARILESFQALGAVDTSGVEPMASPLAEPVALREDSHPVEQSAAPSALRDLGPDTLDGRFRVPRVHGA
jgi:aspartyl/glutamyl-tRNA(Asn/Gln) amidotransferase C subunit